MQTPHEEILLQNARARSRREKLPFDLSLEDIEIPRVRPLLGIELVRPRDRTLPPNAPSIDKIVPERGYVKGNVRVISFRANAMKRDASKDEIAAFCRNIAAYLGDS